MKKSLFCLLLASFMALSACGGMGDLQSSISSDHSSILDSSSLDNSSILDDSPILDSSLLGDSSTPDDSSVVGSSTPNEVVKGEKVVDEATWNTAIEKSFQNYTLTGRVWYDNTICDAVIRIEDTKGRCSLSAIQETVDGTLISGFMETGGMVLNDIVYGYEKTGDTPIDNLADVIWEPSFFEPDEKPEVQPTPNSVNDTEKISDDANSSFKNYWFAGYYQMCISELCVYSNFSYNEEESAYIYDEEECTIKIWFENGEIKKLECENIGFTETDGGQLLVHWATIEFGETVVEFETYPNVN